jgi:hypothetical protein
LDLKHCHQGDPWVGNQRRVWRPLGCALRDQTAHIITPAGWWSAFGMDGASASGASTGGERKRKGGRAKSACPVCHKKQRKCNGTKTGCTYNILHSDVAQQTASSSKRPTRAAAITETDRLSYPQNQHRQQHRGNRQQRQQQAASLGERNFATSTSNKIASSSSSSSSSSEGNLKGG